MTEPNGRGTRRTGRTILLHPQEELLQAARAFQQRPAFTEVRRRRQAAEHRLARLVQLGIRQARYVGRAKTLFQLALAAAVANLTLLAGRGSAHPSSASAVFHASSAAALLRMTFLVVLLAHALTHSGIWSHQWRRAVCWRRSRPRLATFRPDF